MGSWTTSLRNFQVSGLFVIARNSSFQWKGKPADVRQVGRDLGVRYVLEGSVRRAGDRIRIAAQLVNAENGGHFEPRSMTTTRPTSLLCRTKSRKASSVRSSPRS